MSEDEAKRRFMQLTVLRFGGVVLALFGILIVVGKVGANLPEAIGWLLVALGTFDVIVLPQMLVRAWKRGD